MWDNKIQSYTIKAKGRQWAIKRTELGSGNIIP